jgi:two-component SAPR family response regulator
MATKADLEHWVLEGVKASGGEASIVQVAEHIWKNYRSELENSGQLLYTWQYDMRWAAQNLRAAKKLTFAGRKWALK